MQPNPVLRRLGFADTDRVVIIHTDDIGMCQASVDAFAHLWDVGIISSGAVMVPCPWFLHAAAYARSHPQADLGVHTTITCEWQTYRWGPVSTRDPRSGMIDAEGCFYRSSPDAQAHGDPGFVTAEIEAQVRRALAAGMQPTHLDTHMGTVASPKFMPGYLKVALKYRLPPMVFRMDEAAWMSHGLDADAARMAVSLMEQFQALGLPLLDFIRGMDLGRPGERLAQAKAALGALEPGITHFILHPSTDTPEIRAIAPDAQARIEDYQTFLQEDLRVFLRAQGLQVIGYRALQELMPDPAALPELPF